MTAVSASRRPAGDPDPYRNYAWLRENAPVSPLYSPHGAGTTWLVTSYELARACLNDPRLSNDSRKARGGPDTGQDDATARGLLNLDRPEHARLRGMVVSAFSPQAVARWRPMIERVTTQALDELAGRDTADLVTAFALPVPVAIIHEVLGVPAGERKDPARCFDLFYRAGLAQPNQAEPYVELLAYIDHLIAYKRACPGDDVTSLLLDQLGGGELHGVRELRSMLLGILGAGHVTTVQFFGSAALRLLEHPGQLADLRAGTARWSDAVTEMLRFDSPIQATQHRYATQDLTIGDVAVARGDAVLISVAAANRDPGRFPDPAQFQVTRRSRSNLAFGHGVHLCLGAHLARLEGEIGLDLLFRRFPELALAIPPQAVTWQYGPMLRGPAQLPVTLTADR
jgi:cytochrome P450